MSYFAATQDRSFRPIEFDLPFAGSTLRWVSAAGVFSRHELDPGSALLLECSAGIVAPRLLDLGCGHGALGLLHLQRQGAGLGVLVDVNPHACRAAALNQVRLGVRALVVQGDGGTPARPGAFELVLTNPPIRAGLPVIDRFWDHAALALRPGGVLLFVGRPKQGGRRLAERAATRLGGPPERVERWKGYEVFRVPRT